MGIVTLPAASANVTNAGAYEINEVYKMPAPTSYLFTIDGNITSDPTGIVGSGSIIEIVYNIDPNTPDGNLGNLDFGSYQNAITSATVSIDSIADGLNGFDTFIMLHGGNIIVQNTPFVDAWDAFADGDDVTSMSGLDGYTLTSFNSSFVAFGEGPLDGDSLIDSLSEDVFDAYPTFIGSLQFNETATVDPDVAVFNLTDYNLQAVPAPGMASMFLAVAGTAIISKKFSNALGVLSPRRPNRWPAPVGMD